MIRNLKALGVAALAVFAMGAIVASSASAAEFTSASGTYPVNGSGESTADVFDAFGSTVKCTENKFVGTIASKTPKASVVPTYKNCKPFGTFPATVTCGSCEFHFYNTGTVEFTGTILIHAYENATKHAENKPMCAIHIQGPQDLGTVTYTNSSPEKTINVSGNVTGITATQTRNSIFCPAGTHTSTATYTIQAGGINISGTSKGESNPIHFT